MPTQWTVMIYLGADNNLGVDFLWNLKEMQEVEEVGPLKAVTVVAQYDPGQGIPTQRYVINQESFKGRKKFIKEPSSRDGWLILDDDGIDGIPTVRAEVKDLVGKQLEKIAGDCATEEGKLMAELVTDSELQRKFGLKKGERLTELQADLLKGYFRTPEGLSKLRNDTLRNLVFGFELARAKEERFREYETTLEGSKDPKNKNTGDPTQLLEFILWGITTYTADNYMVVLAGHGSGAVEDFLLKDENSRDSLTLHELRDVFELVKQQQLGKKLAILGMDSCLMSMAEVYYQLVGSVQHLVGAEGFEPSAGWPYQRILDSLVKRIIADPKRKVGAETFAKDIVDKYVLYYFDYALAGLSVDLAACKIVKDDSDDSLTVAIAQLGLSLKARLLEEDPAGLELVISARRNVQCYKFDQYVDLVDFCNKLKDEVIKLNKSAANNRLGWLCTKVKKAVIKVVKNSSYVGTECQESNGLSVYFPWNSVPKAFCEGYEQLEFTQHTDLTQKQIDDLKLHTYLTQKQIDDLTHPTDFTLHTNSEWYRFIETFTEKMRALIPTEGAGGKTLFSAKTLHSGTTLYTQPPSLYTQPPSLYTQPPSLYTQPPSLGSGGSLAMAYCKPPSLFWKPKKDKIETQLQRLRKVRSSAVNAAKKKKKPVPKGKVTPAQNTSAQLERLLKENLGVVKKKP